MAEQKGIAESVKDAIVGSIRGTGEIVNVVVDIVNRTLVNALKGTGAVGTAVTTTVADVLRGAILGSAQVGADVGAAARARSSASSAGPRRSASAHPMRLARAQAQS